MNKDRDLQMDRRSSKCHTFSILKHGVIDFDWICMALKLKQICSHWKNLPSLIVPISTVHVTMKTALNTLTSEQERLKQCVDHETIPPTSPQVVGLKNALTTVCETTQTHTLTHKYCQSVEISIPPSYRLTSQKPAPHCWASLRDY